MYKNITIFSVLFLFLFSCGTGDKNVGNNDLYFPIEKLLDQQIDSLHKSNDVWKKRVEENGKEEEKDIIAKDVTWKTELAMFYDLTPNKNAYAGKFKIDTAFKEDENIITYESDDLKLAMLIIRQNKDGSTKAVYGDLRNQNLFYSSYYELSFIPNNAFMISARQTLAFFNSEKEFSISWVKEKTDSVTTVRNEQK
jgi:hypothetical protein